MSSYLRTLLDAHGYTVGSFSRAVGVSSSGVRKWLDGERPRRDNAVTVARLFPRGGAEHLLTEWGYEDSIPALDGDKQNHDPNVANGWRLDTLIAEIRQTNKILNRIEQHLAPKPAAVLETEAVLSEEQVRELKERWRGDDETVEESNDEW